MRFKQRNSGFTLIELLVTAAVLAIVSMFAIPAFETLVMNNRITSQTNQLSSQIAYARSEATKRPSGFITLCPTSDSATCSGNATWEDGWLVFFDLDGDRTVDAADDVIRQVIEPLDGGNTLRVSGLTNASYVQFDRNGQPMPSALGASPAGTFTLCDSRGAGEARAVVVAVSGQTRLAQDEDADAVPNGHTGNNVTCP